MGKDDWIRIEKRFTHNPCPICGHWGWCLLHRDGSAAICKRVSEGYNRNLGDAGYLFKLRDDDNRPTPRPRTPKTTPPPAKDERINWQSLSRAYAAALSEQGLNATARSLGVSPAALALFEIGKTGAGATTFPMRNSERKHIGIRIRASDGRKWAVRGSRNGLFIAQGERFERLLLVCEGPTDAAALVGIGFDTIGRPSCDTGNGFLGPQCKGRDVVVVADRDGPGRNGAHKCAQHLLGNARSVKIIMPHYQKDARDWIKSGATYDVIRAAIASAPYVQRSNE